MSPRMPTMKSRTMMAFLEHLGFQHFRLFRHPDGRTATVPEHPGEDLGRGLTSKILRDAEVTRDDFWEWYLQR